MEYTILRVDLSKDKIWEEKVGEKVIKKYLGGRGLGVKILYEETEAGIDPFGEENRLIFMTGYATGTAVPLSGRFHVITKSPLTGGIGDSNCGGQFGPMLRFAGYEGIVVQGIADNPVYLYIEDGHAELRDASHLWGKGTWSTEDTLREELGKDINIVSIGPAGENKVMMAAIINDKHRAAGRTGVGAVMGSKKLKAIVVRKGKRKPEVHDEAKLKEAVENVRRIVRESPVTGEALPTYGTAVLVNIINETGGFPTRNFKTGVFEKANEISGEKIAETYLVRKKACWGCIVACGRVTKVETPPYQVDGEGPEYETAWSLGAMCGISDLAAVIKAHNLCDDLGMDPISFGSTVACAMELYENGKIPEEKLGGLKLEWGNPQTVVELAWRTAFRDGFGDEIAMGAKRLAEKYGMPDLAMHVKGLELPAYDPRAYKGHGLGYATSNRGGCHLRAYMIAPEVLGIPEKLDPLTPEGKAQWVKIFQDLFCIVDSMVVCKFITFAVGAEELLSVTNPITGWDWNVDEFMKAGERIYNLERLYINREGFDGKDDTLPKRLLEEPMPEGAAKGHVVELDKMLEEFYRIRGWVNGKPTEEKLRELDIP
ncbi:Aldehyde ferredoxin oxidoreductase [Ferroglobus placidus DSM 10642]|uniref:Aldehyde ferredoxin oxidoreductase n=1 Tax=Ferroglobus placidus (strain DSM 10642 / AEDII12DO) TaxID=589924 RepID=D3S0H1_FERPA|nr:aldehyde ferredoxin oxidoreductase family protein [Ferroglobus placidus]ADC66234.1 Aldehyde ferredoxin oxidoreductase [Ferroglobus placidus DSM 10642]